MELNRATLDCMITLRRRLREELALDIRLNQPDALTAMLDACLGSSDEGTRALGLRLAQLSDHHAVQRAEPVAENPASRLHSSSAVRIYRGQRVYV